jgi:hypothetical protein
MILSSSCRPLGPKAHRLGLASRTKVDQEFRALRRSACISILRLIRDYRYADSCRRKDGQYRRLENLGCNQKEMGGSHHREVYENNLGDKLRNTIPSDLVTIDLGADLGMIAGDLPRGG